VGGWAIGRRSPAARFAATAGGVLLFYPAPAVDVAGLAALVAALTLARRRAAVRR
jgi:hypothetical protein